MVHTLPLALAHRSTAPAGSHAHASMNATVRAMRRAAPHAALVFVTWLNVLVIEPNAEALGPASQVASPFIVLRILRLAKLARAVRLVAQARSLWLLVRGMAGSLLTMFYTFIIIFVALLSKYFLKK